MSDYIKSTEFKALNPPQKKQPVVVECFCNREKVLKARRDGMVAIKPIKHSVFLGPSASPDFLVGTCFNCKKIHGRKVEK